MQLPEPPPPLAPLWDRVIRAQALPPDLDVQLLYVAIRDRLTHPEWEVRLHALRVLADLLPLSGNALDFPFDQVVDNLGHGSPNVRKAALDALKVFCSHCEDPDCAARAILDKCSYGNIRPHSANMDTKANVVTGLILSIPAVLGILKRRNSELDTYPIFIVLGDKLFDPVHKDVALRSLLKLRRVFGPREYLNSFSKLDHQTQDKFRIMCELYDEDSLDVHYGPRYRSIKEHNNSHLLRINHAIHSVGSTPVRLSADSSSDESYFVRRDDLTHSFAKVIIETEIKFDSDTAITMTVLEGNETETDSDKLGSEEDCDSSDRNMLKYSDCDSEDTDVVVSKKRVRFGGETFKIRTPDSDNITSDNVTSEDDNKGNNNNITGKEIVKFNNNVEQDNKQTSPINKIEEIKNINSDNENNNKTKKSGIPLPVIQTKIRIQKATVNDLVKQNKSAKQKSKSLSELYDYFRTKSNGEIGKSKETSGFALTISEVRSPEKVPSPVESHREVEVLHNLQRSPSLSPRRRRTQLQLEQNGFVLNVLATNLSDKQDLKTLRASSPMRPYYEWEDFDIVPKHVIEQLHNTENWISTVKAADQLHSALLEESNVEKVEPAAKSLVQHMWALCDAVPSARAPAEGAVCALIRTASADHARALLPLLVARLASDPPPAALPHALLQRVSLHHLIDLIFDPDYIGASNDAQGIQNAQLRATLCVARSAGPAAVIAAVRRRLAGTARAESFCQKLRENLNRPLDNSKPQHVSRSSYLPVPVRRRARSTPPPAAPHPPRRLRPLPDSAPLLGTTNSNDLYSKRLSPIPLSDKDSSAATVDEIDAVKPNIGEDVKPKKQIEEIKEQSEVYDKPDSPPPPPRSPSILVEDCSEHSQPKSIEVEEEEQTSPRRSERSVGVDSLFGSQKSLHSEPSASPALSPTRKKSSPSLRLSRSVSPSPTRSRFSSPVNSGKSDDRRSIICERDVRSALAECIVPPRHEDWEVIVSGLVEAERLATDAGARAPASSWRAVVRSCASHVRSLRSRVARTACIALGAVFEHRGRLLDPELEEAAGSLLDRCADVNRFLRSDAASALVRVSCGGSASRSIAALVRRGATHRAGPVRAAAAQALAELVRFNGASRVLDLPTEPRTLLLRTAAELLGDANAETRAHARRLCLVLAEDIRFRPMLKESMPLARYRAVEKNVDKLRSR